MIRDAVSAIQVIRNLHALVPVDRLLRCDGSISAAVDPSFHKARSAFPRVILTTPDPISPYPIGSRSTE